MQKELISLPPNSLISGDFEGRRLLCVPMLYVRHKQHAFHVTCIFVFGDICEEVILPYSFRGFDAACLFSEIVSVICFTGETLVWAVNTHISSSFPPLAIPSSPRRF